MSDRECTVSFEAFQADPLTPSDELTSDFLLRALWSITEHGFEGHHKPTHGYHSSPILTLRNPFLFLELSSLTKSYDNRLCALPVTVPTPATRLFRLFGEDRIPLPLQEWQTSPLDDAVPALPKPRSVERERRTDAGLPTKESSNRGENTPNRSLSIHTESPLNATATFVEGDSSAKFSSPRRSEFIESPKTPQAGSSSVPRPPPAASTQPKRLLRKGQATGVPLTTTEAEETRAAESVGPLSDLKLPLGIGQAGRPSPAPAVPLPDLEPGMYQIYPRHCPDLVLGLVASEVNTLRGSTVALVPRHTSGGAAMAAQVWTIRRRSDGLYNMSPLASPDLRLDCASERGLCRVVEATGASPLQSWRILPLTQDFFVILCKKDNVALEVCEAETSRGAPLLTSAHHHRLPHQQFAFISVDQTSLVQSSATNSTKQPRKSTSIDKDPESVGMVTFAIELEPEDVLPEADAGVEGDVPQWVSAANRGLEGIKRIAEVNALRRYFKWWKNPKSQKRLEVVETRKLKMRASQKVLGLSTWLRLLRRRILFFRWARHAFHRIHRRAHRAMIVQHLHNFWTKLLTQRTFGRWLLFAFSHSSRSPSVSTTSNSPQAVSERRVGKRATLSSDLVSPVPSIDFGPAGIVSQGSGSMVPMHISLDEPSQVIDYSHATDADGEKSRSVSPGGRGKGKRDSLEKEVQQPRPRTPTTRMRERAMAENDAPPRPARATSFVGQQSTSFRKPPVEVALVDTRPARRGNSGGPGRRNTPLS